jgi:Mg-chelatase subunit ChlD
MNSKKLALKVLGIEAVIVALLGAAAFFYVKAVNESARRGLASQQNPPPTGEASPDLQTFSASYAKDGRSVEELAGSILLRPAVDSIAFVIDTSASMTDDRQDLRDSIKRIRDRYKGRAFIVVNFTGVAQVAGEPTRDLVELQKYIDGGFDLGGHENSYLALTTAASKAREKFKNPAIVLMTDAAPNDGKPGSNSQMTIDQAADALNAANAELHVWAAFDYQEFSSGGSAATTDLYPDLLSKVKAGGKLYLVKRDNFDPGKLMQPFR